MFNVFITIILALILLSFIFMLYNLILKPVILLIHEINYILHIRKKKIIVKQNYFKILISKIWICGYVLGIIEFSVFTLKILVKTILKFLKKLIKTVLIWCDVKNFTEFIYIFINLCIIMFVVLGLFLIINKNFNVISESHFIFAFMGCLGAFIFMYIIMLSINKYLYLNDRTSLLCNFLVVFIWIVMVIMGIFVLFEHIKNYGIPNKKYLYLTFTILLYTVIFLLHLIKIILDRGSILISVFGGLIFYVITMIFLSTAMGFFVTGFYPKYFEKDTITIESNYEQSLIPYLASYSYRGAEYLLSFPNEDDFKIIKDDSIEEYERNTYNYCMKLKFKRYNMNISDEIFKEEKPKIPFGIYIIYFVGIFFNVIIFAFFVSYSTSVVILKNSSTEEKYLEFIHRQNTILDDYILFIKWRVKKCKNVWKKCI